MARDKQDITEAEMAIMQLLWKRPQEPGAPAGASTRQIADELYGGRAGVAQYATLQKQLERLEAKGFVHRDRSLFVHLFSAAIERDELIGRRVREMVDKLCEGSLAPVLSHLFKAKALSAQERQALRDLIDDDEAGGKATPRETPDGKAAKGGKPKRTR